MAKSKSGKIIGITERESFQQAKLEEWLKHKISLDYGEDDDAIKNPLIRILTKFEALDDNSQHRLYGYANGRILGPGKETDLGKKLWCTLESGKRDAWEDIEEYANELMINNKVPLNTRQNEPERANSNEKSKYTYKEKCALKHQIAPLPAHHHR